MVNDILDLSKVEAGKVEYEPSEVNLEFLIQNSLVMVKEKAMKHDISLTTRIDGIPPLMIADQRKLKQIIFNLLSNAVKFTPSGGEVCLGSRLVDCVVRPGLRRDDPDHLLVIEDASGGEGLLDERQKCVEIFVSDSGIGIRREDQERIFAPFEQADGSLSRKFEGTGLGLFLTRRLVELHGGRIWVESEGENKGSTFHVLIPTVFPREERLNMASGAETENQQ